MLKGAHRHVRIYRQNRPCLAQRHHCRPIQRRRTIQNQCSGIYIHVTREAVHSGHRQRSRPHLCQRAQSGHVPRKARGARIPHRQNIRTQLHRSRPGQRPDPLVSTQTESRPTCHRHRRHIRQTIRPHRQQLAGIHPCRPGVAIRAREAQGSVSILRQRTGPGDGSRVADRIRPLEDQRRIVRNRTLPNRSGRSPVTHLQDAAADGRSARERAVPSQHHRSGGQLGQRTRARNLSGIIQRSRPVECQDAAVRHIPRAERSYPSTIPHLQRPGGNRRQTSIAVRSGQAYRVRPLLFQRARAGNHHTQRIVIRPIQHQPRIVDHIPAHPTCRSRGTQLQRPL